MVSYTWSKTIVLGEDSLFGANKEVSSFLKTNKVNHTFRETSGAHTWMVWRRYLHEVAPLLFR